jgi:hypothetical protein
MGKGVTLGSSENLPGMRFLRGYKSEKAAKAKVAQLRKQGYKAKYEKLMGTCEVWVSSSYFKKHPGVKGALLR